MLEHELTPHPDEQRNLAELRSEFRAAALSHLRDQYSGHHPLGWMMTGDPARARDRYYAELWSFEMLHHLDDPVTQDFGLGDVPSSLSSKVERYAKESLMEATFPADTAGTYDHDAPACCDVGEMTDEELCDYVTASIEESARG
jgi:hypothetical protein